MEDATPDTERESIFSNVNSLSTSTKILVSVVIFLVILLIVRTRNSNFVGGMDFKSWKLPMIDGFKGKRRCKCATHNDVSRRCGCRTTKN